MLDVTKLAIRLVFGINLWVREKKEYLTIGLVDSAMTIIVIVKMKV